MPDKKRNKLKKLKKSKVTHQEKEKKVPIDKNKSVSNDTPAKGNKPAKITKEQHPENRVIINFDNLEYFKDAYCFFYKNKDNVYRTFSLPSKLGEISSKPYVCTCKKFQKNGISCEHIKELKDLFINAKSTKSYYNQQTFQETHLYKAAKLLSEKDHSVVSSCKLNEESNSSIILCNNLLKPTISYHGISSDDRQRFKERFTHKGGEKPRGEVLHHLFKLFLTKPEVQFVNSGYITPKLLFEQSIWYRFAYHIHNEFQSGIRFMISAGENNQSFQLNGFIGKTRIFDCTLPENLKNNILGLLQDTIIKELPENIKELEGYVSYKLQMNKLGGIKIQQFLKTIDDKGIEEKHELKYLPTGNHKIFIDNIGLVDIQPIKDKPDTPIFESKTISLKDVPEFIKECGNIFLQSQYHEIDPIVRELKIYEEPKEFYVEANTMERDWCDFNISLPIGSSTIPLYEIIRNKQTKKRYLKVENGWIDSQSQGFKNLSENIEFITNENLNSDKIKLTKIELLRFLSMLPGEVTTNSGNAKDNFDSFIQLKPIHADFNLTKFNCSLRHYQEIGVKWLTFLAENDLGGLLCDDMGLGKTHQLMGLMTLYVEKLNETKPFLVICPTTVISHWHEKISKFAPALNPQIYHGQERELDHEFKPGDIILTSYGIIRNDIHALEKVQFSLAVFDEIQNLKNKNTKSYKAAKKLNFTRGFGLSGTPIENRLSELKSLMDIVLPGYLGNDHSFEKDYISPIEVYDDKKIKHRLNRMVSPFVLRRLKDSVLKELPRKIEDVRSCELSPEQIVLYRKALATKGKLLQEQLNESQSAKDIPYLHIFALLQLLKQICNHPALVAVTHENYQKHDSGKWNLFKEILAECLDSGHKVVVFTQFLGMIDIMKNHLQEENISFVTLTGKSRNRGNIIKTFNEDNSCKVFLGSLKAGGTGIDLVAASIVIHYDRWWNAAKEDQATDRVHRIGQTRGVQVFKFVTKDTLEEKIASIIDRKRKLMNSVVKEDSADSLKTFTKVELYDLLSDTISKN